MSIYTFITAVLLSSFSSSSFVSAQEFFAYNDVDLVSAIPLNKCVFKGSNSMIYRFHNGTHAVQKIFTGSTSCDESFLSSQLFYEGYYTDFQSLVNDHIAYQAYSYDNNCDAIYLYIFFKEKDCIKGLNNLFYSITISGNKISEINYHVNNEEDMCDFKNHSGEGILLYDNECTLIEQGGSHKAVINHAKIHQCEENATDSVGIILVFLFMCLILF